MSDERTFAESVAQHLPFLSRLVLHAIRGNRVSEDIVQATHADRRQIASRFWPHVAVQALRLRSMHPWLAPSL